MREYKRKKLQVEIIERDGNLNGLSWELCFFSLHFWTKKKKPLLS